LFKSLTIAIQAISLIDVPSGSIVKDGYVCKSLKDGREIEKGSNYFIEPFLQIIFQMTLQLFGCVLFILLLHLSPHDDSLLSLPPYYYQRPAIQDHNPLQR